MAFQKTAKEIAKMTAQVEAMEKEVAVLEASYKAAKAKKEETDTEESWDTYYEAEEAFYEKGGEFRNLKNRLETGRY